VSRADDILGRLTGRAPAPPPAPAAPPALPPGGPAVSPHGLRERRTRLARELAELQWDLGGAAYEMAIRDHFRIDVLAWRAARLQEVDAELGEVERLARLEDAGAGGECRVCGALHSRGATFCWRCGSEIMSSAAPEVLGGGAAGTHAGGAGNGHHQEGHPGGPGGAEGSAEQQQGSRFGGDPSRGGGPSQEDGHGQDTEVIEPPSGGATGSSRGQYGGDHSPHAPASGEPRR